MTPLKNANLVSCEEMLKQYVQVEPGGTLQSKLGPEGWRALVGPAKKYGVIYTVSDCLFAASGFPAMICLYLAVASNPYFIVVGFVAVALIAQWTVLFYTRHAKPEHVVLDETATDKRLALR